MGTLFLNRVPVISWENEFGSIKFFSLMGEIMRVEEDYLDVLHDIESVIAKQYKLKPEMTDYPVLRVYEALVVRYSAEARGRTARAMELSGIELELLDGVAAVCELRLGRGGFAIEGAEARNPIDVSIMVLCLKSLVKSVEKWSKHGGRRGYLDFMTPYVK